MWRPGYWQWTGVAGSNWQWAPGQYVLPPSTASRWVPSTWAHETGRGCAVRRSARIGADDDLLRPAWRERHHCPEPPARAAGRDHPGGTDCDARNGLAAGRVELPER